MAEVSLLESRKTAREIVIENESATQIAAPVNESLQLAWRANKSTLQGASSQRPIRSGPRFK